MLFGLLATARAPMQLANAQVAVSDLRTHAAGSASANAGEHAIEVTKLGHGVFRSGSTISDGTISGIAA